MYHNTTHLTGEPLRRGRSKAQAQKDAVLELFKFHPTDWITPELVLQVLVNWGAIPETTPITSIRRAITDLTNDLLLEKSATADGRGNGAPCHRWRLRVQSHKQQTLFNDMCQDIK